MEETVKKMRPHVAIINSNTLAMIGLRDVLQNVMPIMEVDTFCSYSEFEEHDTDNFMHYFVEASMILEHRLFFIERRMKTIVLTTTMDNSTNLSGFHSLCVNIPEDKLIRSILILEQHAHAHGKNLPEMPREIHHDTLTNREIEVLSLIVQGNINKEIADRLNISMTTVITHRKHIMDKLKMKSVSALTIYAVMHGYVDINKVSE